MGDLLDLQRIALRLDVGIEDKLDVRSFNVDDGLAALFSVDLEVTCSNPAVDLEELVGSPAAFHIELDRMAYPDLPKRSWSGVVSEAHLVRSEPAGVSTYQLTISPRLWLATRRSNCRVFQQLSDLDVVKLLLGEWGIDAEIDCTATYKTRKYRVQYQETDFAFLSRLLEAAGITLFFRDEDGESKLVLSDAPERRTERKQPLDHVDSPVAGTRWATQLRASRVLTSGKISVADHDHRMPNQPLVAETTASQHPVESRLESYAYAPGAFRFGGDGPKDTPNADDRGRTRTDPREGQRITEQLGSAAIARSRRFVFESNAIDLTPGLGVTVSQHAATERAGKLLVTRVVVSGTHDEPAQITVHATNADRPYRPDAVTPMPQIQGVESAVVVGPAGETIHCDEFGRVRVQFHWDRYGKMDEFSSCWVPVSQAWAGEGLGALNIPRVGQEVVVSFLGGNPEEPVIVGRIFTNLLRPPLPLPANKTQNGFRSASVPKTGGYNELMFEDKAGSEEIRIRAEKDWNTRVNNDTNLSVGRDRKMRIDRDDREHVQGSQRNSVVGRMMSSVGADKLASVVGDLLSLTGGQRVMQTIGDFVSSALSHRIASEAGTTLTVGASMIHIAPDCIVIQSPKILLNPGEKAAESAALTGVAPAPAAE